MKQWKTLARQNILDHNKYLQVEQHTIQLPDGTIIEQWPWVVSPDFVLVLPVTEHGTVLLFEQVKYAVKGTSLAPVGGYLEPGEDPLVAAKRELREEMGCEAKEWVPLGSYPVNGNHGGGTGHLYLAMEAFRVGDQIIDDLEEMVMVEMTVEEAEQRMFRGEVKVLGWLAMVAMGLLALKSQGKVESEK